MRAEFQSLFVDPTDHASLRFDGETIHGRWRNGYLRSPHGAAWPVREGVPDFLREPVSGFTEEQITGYLTGGTFEGNMQEGRRMVETNGPAWREIGPFVVERGGPVVDIASGPGGGFMPSLLAFNPQAVVLATDAAPVVVHGWRSHFEQSGAPPGVCFAAFDARKMPLASGSVRTLTSMMGFSSIADRKTAFCEAARVLADDGMLYGVEGGLEEAGLTTLFARMSWDFEAQFGGYFAQSLADMFDECGLKVVKEQPCYRRVLRPDDNEYGEAAHRLGLEVWVRGDVFWLMKRR